MRLVLDNAAADGDRTRRSGADDGVAELRDRPPDRFPHRVVRGYPCRILDPSRLQRWTRSQPFDAIAVIRTRAGEVVPGQARDANVAELAMGEAARRPAVDD